MRLFCGDPMCKKPVEAKLTQSPPWPLRCAACGRALYPQDVIEQSLPNELEPKRGQLMTERGGRRVSVTSAELGGPTGTTPGDVDRLLAMVDVGDAPARAGRSRAVWLVAIVTASAVVVIAAGLALGWF